MKLSKLFHIIVIFIPATNHVLSKLNYKHNLSEFSFLLKLLFKFKFVFLLTLCIPRVFFFCKAVFKENGKNRHLVVEESKKEK